MQRSIATCSKNGVTIYQVYIYDTCCTLDGTKVYTHTYCEQMTFKVQARWPESYSVLKESPWFRYHKFTTVCSLQTGWSLFGAPGLKIPGNTLRLSSIFNLQPHVQKLCRDSYEFFSGCDLGILGNTLKKTSVVNLQTLQLKKPMTTVHLLQLACEDWRLTAWLLPRMPMSLSQDAQRQPCLKLGLEIALKIRSTSFA